MWSEHLITVIPSEVEAATQPRKLSGRGQTSNPVAQLKGNTGGCLDFARHDKLFVRFGTDL
jgi:hypothetical protein